MPCIDTLNVSKLESDEANNQGAKQQGAQASGAQSNKRLIYKYLSCCGPSSPGGINNDQPGPSSELGEVLPLRSQPNSSKSDMDSRL